MSCFLFEIFSEELPSQTQQLIEKKWHDHAMNWTQKNQIDIDSTCIKIFSTPQRTAITISGLSNEIIIPSSEKKGPRVGDDQALEHFLKKHNAMKNSCAIQNIKGVDFWILQEKESSVPIELILIELCDELAYKTTGPQMMRWGSEEDLWFRPIHGIVAMIDSKVIDWSYGNGNRKIKSSNIIYGHKFIDDRKIVIANPSDYEEILLQKYVIADSQKRKSKIIAELNNALGFDVKNDPLIDEINGLIEWPSACIGSFDEKFLSMPKEIIETVLRNHQRNFAMIDRDNANKSLLPKFAFVSNAICVDKSGIISGNEKVVRARLSDGLFFWNIDKNIRKEECEKRLNSKVFFEKLGSIGDKIERLKKVSKFFDCAADLATAAEYSKLDICMETVREFPELQGIIGSHYARDKGIKEEICQAIAEQYWTIDRQQPSQLGQNLALIDNLDKIIAFFSIDIFPSGSSDPFALRRSGNIVAHLLMIDESIDLKKFHNIVASHQFANDLVASKVKEFIFERLQKCLRDHYDICNEVIAIFPFSKCISFYEILSNILALNNAAKSSQWTTFLENHKRVDGLICNASENFNAYDFIPDQEVEISQKITAHFVDLNETADYKKSLQFCIDQSSCIKEFLDNITVSNAEDPRHLLYKKIIQALDVIFKIVTIIGRET